MPSKVYLAPAAKEGGLAEGAVKRLFDAAGLGECFGDGDAVALKLHFGEPGNRDVWQPAQVREAVECVTSGGGRPFLTDANVLYRSLRHNAVTHLAVAAENGFSYESCGCPLMIADGLRGEDYVELPVPGGKHHRKAKIGAGIARADAVISLTHVTGHIQFGLGGAIKNLGMGSGSIAGKQMMHEHFKPEVNESKCISCGACAEHCPVAAITVPEGSTAEVDESKCIGCGECVAHCPSGAIPVQWGETVGLQERTAEFCAALMAGRPERFGFISLLTGVTGSCDCLRDRGKPIVPDIGALASRDIAAVDQAALDLICREKNGERKLQSAAPSSRLGLAHEYAESLGLGSREYQLVEV